MASAKQLETARLVLRRWRPEDEAAMAAINADPEVTRYLNRPVDAAATAAFYARVMEHWEEHGFGFWAVELRAPASGPAAPAAEPARLIGFAGVAHPTFLPALAARPELGWRLTREAWGRGLATEAATAARDHAFATLGLAELISIIHPENARSRRVATKLGMTLTEHVRVPALERDADVWVLAAPALPTRPGRIRPS
jgi:RimJ/RimL family protein N-acetyltransferase